MIFVRMEGLNMFFKTIGYVVTERFCEMSIIEAQAVLGINPTNRRVVISENTKPISGKAGLTVVPDATFDSCPKLDVIVIGDIPLSELDNKNLIQFIRSKVLEARYVLASNGGVLALAKAKLLADVRVKTNRKNITTLKTLGSQHEPSSSVVVDDKFYTTGSITGLIEASFMVLERLSGKWFAKLAELNLEYHPTKNLTNSLPCQSVENNNENLDSVVNVGIILPSYAYLPDVIGIVGVLCHLPGYKLHVVSDSLKPSKCLLGPTILPTTTYADCPQVDVLAIGATTPKYLEDLELLNFIRKQDENAKTMISVCAGTLIFAAAGVLDGKEATSNFHHTPLLKRLGVKPNKDEKCVSGKYYSAGPAIGAIEIGIEMIAKEIDEALAKEILFQLEYAPNPLYEVGSLAKAGPILAAISKLISFPTLPFYLLSGKRGRKTLEQKSSNYACL